MALEDAFEQLQQSFERLYDAADRLRMMITEDRPAGDDVVLFDLLGDAAIDNLGWLEEALSATSHGREALAQAPNLRRARFEMITAHEKFIRIIEKFSSELGCYERIEELNNLGREFGDGWPVWVQNIKKSMSDFRQPLLDCHRAFFACWKEVSAHCMAASVSVQNTNIGQQFYGDGLVDKEGLKQVVESRARIGGSSHTSRSNVAAENFNRSEEGEQ